MSPWVDNEGEMSFPPTLDDATTEALLAGRPVAPGRLDLDPVAAFVDDVRSLGRDAAPAPSQALAAVFAHGVPSEEPVAATQSPGRRPSGVLSRAAASLAGAGLVVKAGLGAGVAAASVTAAGAAGVLPDAAQDTVRGVVRTVTPFELPEAGGRTEAGRRAGGAPTHHRPGTGEGDGDADHAGQAEATGPDTPVVTPPGRTGPASPAPSVVPVTRASEPAKATPAAGGERKGAGPAHGSTVGKPGWGPPEGTPHGPPAGGQRGPSPGGASRGPAEPAQSHRPPG